MFYGNIAGFQYHPGNPPAGRMSLQEAALIADDMLVEYLKRFS